MNAIGYAILVYLISTILIASIAAWANGWKVLTGNYGKNVRTLNLYVSFLLALATLLIMWRQDMKKKIYTYADRIIWEPTLLDKIIFFFIKENKVKTQEGTLTYKKYKGTLYITGLKTA